MNSSAKFLLGFGARKAGTTWLYRYLNDQQLVSFGPSKEMHAWTLYFDPAYSRRSLGLDRTLRGYVQAKTGEANEARGQLLQELRLASIGLDPKTYLDLFKRLAQKHGRPVADITPDYSRLRPEQIASIYSFLAPHFSLRALFLMRDPVDRLFSECKHNARGLSGSSPRSGSDGIPLLIKHLKSAEMLPGGLKSDYRHAVAMIDSVFRENEALHLFYEDLFCDQSVKKITDFLGVSYATPDFGVRHNADPDAVTLSPEIRREAVRRLLPVYQFVEERFGSLPARWQENLSLL